LPQKHRIPPDIQDAKESGGSKREGFHYIARRRFPLPRNQDLRQETGREPGKIARIFCEVRNLGQRVEFLFALYEKLTAPLTAPSRKRSR